MKAPRWLIATMFALFSVNSLGSCILAASSGCVWSLLDWQAKATVIVAIVVNWTNTMMSALVRFEKKIAAGQPPLGDTTFLTKQQPAVGPPQPKATE